MKRFALGAAGDRVTITALGAKRRYATSGAELAARIIEARGLPPEVIGLEHEIDDEYRAWLEHGWGFALEFYIATSDDEYADRGGDFASVHDDVLTRYEADEPLPVERDSPGSLILVRGDRAADLSVGQLLRKRRSVLVPTRSPLSATELAGILDTATSKVAEFREGDLSTNARTAMTNFGCSLDFYVVVLDVDGLSSGVYRYHPGGAFRRLGDSPTRDHLRRVLVGQPAPMTAAATLLYVSDVHRHRWRYRHPRGLRGLWIDTAKVVNEALWELARRDIRPHMTPAVDDSLAMQLLGLPNDMSHQVLYALSFGGASPPHERGE